MTAPPVNLLARIDACEAYLLRASSHSTDVDWPRFGAEIASAKEACTGEDEPLVTVLDELRLLAHVFAPAGVPPPAADMPASHDPRFGYGVVTTHDREALFPTFASLLLYAVDASELKDALPELSLGDYAIWRELADNGTRLDRRRLASLWLTSPARRLAWDLRALERFGAATGWTTKRVLEAAGGADVDCPNVDVATWPPVHACTPLRALAIDDSDDATIVRALRAVAAPDWVWGRSQAICALLGRAVVNPAYTVQGFTSDVREELPARLGAAFAVPDDEPLIELERELLRAACACIPEVESAAQAFAVARWIGYVLVRSPFHANDPHVLAARLSAIGRDTPLHPGDDLFHPRRILSALQSDFARWREFVVSIGAALHYFAPTEHQLEPAPVTLVEELWRIAGRTLTPAESLAESAHATRRGSSPDGLQRHIAPPWIARTTLHRMRSPWIARLEIPSLEEVLGQVDADPASYSWVTESLARSSRHLTPAARGVIAEWWARTEPSQSLQPHQLALAASAALREIGPQGVSRLDAQILSAAAKWRPSLAHTIATEANQLELPRVDVHFVERLAQFGEDASIPTDQRERAIAWWLQRLLTDGGELTPAIEQRLRALARQPVVTSNPRLRAMFEDVGINDQAPRRKAAQ